MLKRIVDLTAALAGLVLTSPILLAVMLAIWIQDFASPFYIAPRAAKGGGSFNIVKFRSMVVNADKLGGSSTARTDCRITPIGRFIRSWKIDELIQLWNVLIGDMSLVGPRPQAIPDAQLYTAAEQRMLTVRPGITDVSSIVFADEGDILSGSANPDLLYNQIVRPWKSRLALAYIDHQSFITDLHLIVITLLVIGSRRTALREVNRMLRRWNVDPLVAEMASRRQPLCAYPPPGASEVFNYQFSAR